MDSVALGRLLSLVRLRRGRRQSDIGKAARLSPSAIGRHEHGRLTSITRLRRHAEALDLRLDLRLTGAVASSTGWPTTSTPPSWRLSLSY